MQQQQQPLPPLPPFKNSTTTTADLQGGRLREIKRLLWGTNSIECMLDDGSLAVEDIACSCDIHLLDGAFWPQYYCPDCGAMRVIVSTTLSVFGAFLIKSMSCFAFPFLPLTSMIRSPFFIS